MRLLWRLRAFVALWRAWRHRNRPGGPQFRDRVAALPRLVSATLSGRYAGLSRARLGVYVLALVYVMSPVDLVPEALFALAGLADDTLISVWLLGSFFDETERFLIWEGRSRTLPGTILPGT
jgi:uncharacterized membrane protein YkvA (DUF1232 family)